jgi:hypothetical protein
MRRRSKQEDNDLIIGGILLWLIMGGAAGLWVLLKWAVGWFR